MYEYTIYKFIELLIFVFYLMFIFLSIQMWLLWIDINKDEWKLKSIVDETFFKKNLSCIISATIFFITPELLESTILPDAIIIFKFFKVIAIISLLLFALSWHNALRQFAHKTPP